MVMASTAKGHCLDIKMDGAIGFEKEAKEKYCVSRGLNTVITHTKC